MLTDKQQAALDIITEYIARYGKSPTIDEMKETMKQKSKRWVVQYLETLEKKWFITRGSGFRSIKLWNTIWLQTMMPIQILGYANAWTPLVSAQQNVYWVLPISKDIISWDSKEYFVLKVEWTSMNDFVVNSKNIENWSYVLIKKQQTFVENDGNAYLFIVDSSATLKVPKREWENLYLVPKSRDDYHKPIILSNSSNVQVNWKVVDVFNLA